MEPVLICPVRHADIGLDHEPASVAIVRIEFRKITLRSTISVLESGSKFYPIVRYLFEMNSQSVCLVIEPAACPEFRTNRLRYIPSLGPVSVSDFEMDQTPQRE